MFENQTAKFYSSDKLVLFVGALDKRKGMDYLVKAFRHIKENVPNAKLVIVGKGSYNYVLEDTRGCWGSITFTGKISHNEVIQLYQVATIRVIPSIYEQCSYVALEMMKYGLPTVVTAAPGLCELYNNEKDALVVPLFPGNKDTYKLEMDIENLAQSIKRLLEDGVLQERFRKATHSKWQTAYTRQIMGKKTAAEYSKVLEMKTDT